MDHREIAGRVPVMNEVQFLFASEPCKPLKPRPLYVVFLVEKDVRVERRRNHLGRGLRLTDKNYNRVRVRRISVVAGEANAQIGVMFPKSLNLTDRMPSLLRSKRDAGGQFWAGATGT
jgi:hypothetical protein